MKKLISILLVAMLVVTGLATIAFAAGSATLNISSVTAKAGDEVTISFTLAGDEFASYGLKIKADSALTLVKITKGAASESFVANTNSGSSKFGTVTSSATYNTPAGELFTATFKVADNAKPGKYSVSVALDFLADENGQDLGVTINKGYVTIECEHSWGQWTEVEAATCKKVGKEERVCSKCGETEEREIAKTQHSWGAWNEVEAATCKKVGKEERQCSICKDKETREIPKTQHSWSAWTQIEAPSCNKVGKEERQCSICKDKETREVGKISHNWGAWTQVEAPSCNKVGKEERVCSVCGDKETREVAKTAHSWGAWKEVEAPTCNKVGKEERVCSICGDKQTREVAKTEHSWGEWTEVEAASCNKVGKEERVCSICKEKEEREIPMTAHAFGEWTEVEAATCQKVGKEARTCSVCGEIEEREIPKAAHTPSVGYAYDDEYHWHVCTVCDEPLTQEAHDLEWVVTQEASKDSTGLKHEECKICDYCGDDVVIPAYETGDFIPVIAFGALALLALLALVAYLLKRKFKW